MSTKSISSHDEPSWKRVIKSTALRILAFVYLGISFVVFVLPFWIPPIELKEMHKPFYDADVYHNLLTAEIINDLHNISDSIRILPKIAHQEYVDEFLSKTYISMISKTESFLEFKFGLSTDNFNNSGDLIAIFDSISKFLLSGKDNLSVYFSYATDTTSRNMIENILKIEHEKIIQEIHNNTESIQTWIHYKFIIIGSLLAGIFIYLGFGNQENSSQNKKKKQKDDPGGEFSKKLKAMLGDPALVLLMSIVFTIGIIIDIQIKDSVIGSDSSGLWIKNYIEPVYTKAHPKPYGRFLAWEQFLRIAEEPELEYDINIELVRLQFIKDIIHISNSSLTDKRVFIFMLQDNTLNSKVNYGHQSSPKFSFSNWVPKHALSFVVYIVILFLVIQCIMEPKIYWDNRYIQSGLFFMHLTLMCFAFLNHSIPSTFYFVNSDMLLVKTIFALKTFLVFSFILNIFCVFRLIKRNTEKVILSTRFSYPVLFLLAASQVFGFVFLLIKDNNWSSVGYFFMFVVGILYCINISLILFYDSFENELKLTKSQDNTGRSN
ncbi:MAG: hypothetical protein MI922_20265 [Bacteroidales bacterium]|nr:hypothetical protein [Bacteroidales bacterium]